MDHGDGEENPTGILIDVLLYLPALLGILSFNNRSLQHLLLTACPLSLSQLILG